MRFGTVALGLFFALSMVAAERGEEIKLWPGGAPGSEGITAEEVSKPSVNPAYGKLPGQFTVSHYPSIYVFLPLRRRPRVRRWWWRRAAGIRNS
jgi:hypothetical protein